MSGFEKKYNKIFVEFANWITKESRGEFNRKIAPTLFVHLLI